MASSTAMSGRMVDADGRKRDLARIHILKAKLGWSEDEYRDIMGVVCGGIRSSAELDYAGRKRWLAHLEAAEQPNRARKRLPPKQGLCWALWMQLADCGAVEHRTMHALEAFSRRQTGVDAIDWLNRHQVDLVIESLKKWLKREQAPR